MRKKRYDIEQDHEQMISDKFYYNLNRYWSTYHQTVQHIEHDRLTSEIADKYYTEWLSVIATYAHAAHIWTGRTGFAKVHHKVLQRNIENEMIIFRTESQSIKEIIEDKLQERRLIKSYNRQKVVDNICI